jgi:oxygen-independent coproporphyrinogen-3 oxidase
MIAALAECGLSRASIGVQDFDEKVQKAINRIQPFDETKRVVDALRAAGVKSLNIDLIYGLPYQSKANVARTIELSLSLEPQRFAVFGYAHVPHFKKHMQLIKEETLPNADERFEQFELAHGLLSAAGYVAVGLDHFAQPGDSLAVAALNGTLARNFQGYTSDDAPALIGIGASSISSLPQGYLQNKPEVPEWRKDVEAGALPVARGIALSPDDKLRRDIINKLMCFLEVDLAAFGKAPADFPREMEALEPLVAEGFVVRDGTKLRVPASARAAVRLVASVFDSYLANSKAVHAVAV